MKYFLKNILVWFLYFNISLFSRRKENLGYSRVLILAPHPDDEILGLGGYLIRLKESGTKISIVYLTDGENSGIYHDKEEIRNQRIALSEKICSILAVNRKDLFRLHLTDGSLPCARQPGFEDIVNSVKAIIDLIKPEAVFATHSLDFWPGDHVACAYIAAEAVKQSPTSPRLLYYWVWAWYNIRPSQIAGIKFKNLQKIEIHDQLKQKKELIDIYLNALTPDGNPWSGLLPEMLINILKKPFEVLEEAENVPDKHRKEQTTI